METMEVCIHCGDVVEGPHVVVDEAYFNRPRRIAHLDCDRIGRLRPVKAVPAADEPAFPDHAPLRR